MCTIKHHWIETSTNSYVLWTDAAMDALVLGRFDCTSLAYVWRFLATAPGGTEVKTAEVRCDEGISLLVALIALNINYFVAGWFHNLLPSLEG